MPNHSQRVSPHSGGTHNPHIPTTKMNKAILSQEKISDILCDARDVRSALRFASGNLLNKPKDGDDTDTTIGDCLDNIIETLEHTMKNSYIRIEVGHPCGAGASHLSTIWEGRDDECPWDELEEVAKQEGKVLVSSCLSWVATSKGMELIPD